MKYSDIAISPLKGGKYRILSPIVYKDEYVPIGYVTNGGDIPRIFWTYIPPNWSDALPAFIVHDYMCDKSKTKEEYKKADRYFTEILKLLNVDEQKSEHMTSGVSFYTEHIRIYT